MAYFFNGLVPDENLAENINNFGDMQPIAFGNHHNTGNRTQYHYSGSPTEPHSVASNLSLLFSLLTVLLQQYQPNALAQQTLNTSHVSPGNALANASHHDLLGANNRAHTSLYETFIGLKHEVGSKTSTILELKAEVKQLSEQLAQLSRKSTQEYPENRPNKLQFSSDQSLVAPPAPPTLHRANHTKVRFWTKEDWTTYVEKEKNANRDPPWHDYITDEEGLPMSRQRHRELWDHAKTAWNSLYYQRLDPSTWSKKHSSAAT